MNLNRCQICGKLKPYIRPTPSPVFVTRWDKKQLCFNGKVKLIGTVPACGSCAAQLVCHHRCLSPLHGGIATL